jgi:hypothetical protein
MRPGAGFFPVCGSGASVGEFGRPSAGVPAWTASRSGSVPLQLGDLVVFLALFLAFRKAYGGFGCLSALELWHAVIGLF